MSSHVCTRAHIDNALDFLTNLYPSLKPASSGGEKKKREKKNKKENGGALALGKRKKSIYIYAYVYRKYPSYLNIVCVEQDL